MQSGRKAGMDHDIYVYSRIDTRPQFRLPHGARVAFFVSLFEYRELTPPEGFYRDRGSAASSAISRRNTGLDLSRIW